MESLLGRLRQDIRYISGLNSCINCGTCTAICPAAAVSDYDPRLVTDTVQNANETEIIALLKSDTIWYCGECISCKTRCPRQNAPGYLIQALRSLSIESGLFTESREGRKQVELIRTIGKHMLRYGYCVYIDEVDNDSYPEQGPVWRWIRDHRESLLERLGSSYNRETGGTLRKISEASLNDLRRIFEETGALDRWEMMEAALAGPQAGEAYRTETREKVR